MKSTLKLFAMLMLVTFMASCSEGSDELGTTQSTDKEVYMTFSGSTDPTLRTVINSTDNSKIDFAAGDAISVFDKTGKNCPFTTIEGGNVALFGGDATPSDGYTLLYPYQDGATISEGGIVSAVIPAEQVATVGTFDPKANLSIATAADRTNAFKLLNVCSLIRFNVTADYDFVTLTDVNGRYVAGEVKINPADSTATAVDEKASKSVTLKNLKKDNVYYIALLPGAIKLNLKFMTTDGKSFVKTKSSSIVLGRSKVLNIGKITAEESEMTQEWVEIAGLKWATCNVGASSKTEVGNYFTNGEATAVNLGSFWRVPTKQDLDNLKDNSLRVITQDGATIYPLDGKALSYSNYSAIPEEYKYLVNGPCIFLPSTGYTNAYGVKEKETGYYWSSDKKQAFALHFTDNPSVTVTIYGKSSGMCIRPIYVSPVSSAE